MTKLKNLKDSRGFTLIELLVVIAIIGLLASVVLASLNTARPKGADAAVKSNLRNAQTQAEIVYDNASPNVYTGVCDDPNIRSQVTGAASAAGATAPNWESTQGSGPTQAVCHSTIGGYAIIVPLKTDSTQGWCVDYKGAAKSAAVGSLTTGVIVCPP